MFSKETYSRQIYKESFSVASSEQRKLRREKTRFIYNKILDTLTCQECGEGRNVTLDFHHLDEKTKDFTISNMKSKDYSPDKMVEEMSKCAVLCSNCHRVLHSRHFPFIGLRSENKARLTKTVKLATVEWNQKIILRKIKNKKV